MTSPLLGLRFYSGRYNIMRALGNRITVMSPTRGFRAEIGATYDYDCLTVGHICFNYPMLDVMGMALLDVDPKAANWRQLLFGCGGCVLTLPCAGLRSGLLCLEAVNTHRGLFHHHPFHTAAHRI